MKTDYSSEAIDRRLREVSELRRLGLSLKQAGEEIRDSSVGYSGGSGGMTAVSAYSDFFHQVIGSAAIDPFDWQDNLAQQRDCDNRLIRVPTGFGKTLGVFSTWLWHRVHQNDNSWPRRLVWCLPMRVLVEQTEAEVRSALGRLNVLWDQRENHTNRVGVHLLMGGANAGEWHLHPEHCAVLIGTQDMLLSRALNRGYGAARARWPVEFGMLNLDCLWVMDEVQLMDVGLATSGQIQAFREQERAAGKSPRPCYTWWMSATLQRSWLAKSPETRAFSEELPQTVIPPAARHGHLWDDVKKPVLVKEVNHANAIAEIALRDHIDAGRGKGGPTLIVLNTVRDAIDVHAALGKSKDLGSTELRLIHSRFRPHERAGWREGFLNRAACSPGTDRIIVSTQVIEAGVDLSAAVLVTAMAPWASLVQRFGRSARWGGSSRLTVVDQKPKDDKAAAPYTKAELDAAREALDQLSDVAPIHLEAFEETAEGLLIDRLYPYEPRHLLLRNELDELFDITPDLSGADVDISRFIRSGEERDLQVFWQPVPIHEQPDASLRASREALCSVPFLRARDWLCGKESAGSRAPRLLKGMRAWVWDWIDGQWRRPERRDLYPGQTVLVDAGCGGYESNTGWAPHSKRPVEPVPLPQIPPEELADSCQDDEGLSAYPWQTIAVHGARVGQLAAEISSVLIPGIGSLLDLAGRWHDAGKVHDAFQNSIVGAGRPGRRDLAKAPKGAWLPLAKLYPDNEGLRRGGFRHEIASTVALFGVLQRHCPDHGALLGPWRELLSATGAPGGEWRPPLDLPNALEQEILDLGDREFDLLAYLVCAHHGKVRVAWHASASDQEAADECLRIRGIRDSEPLPVVMLASERGDYFELPITTMDLSPAAMGVNPHTGRGWTDRVLGLLEQHGPFTLAWLESILRAADCRASREPIRDSILEGELV